MEMVNLTSVFKRNTNEAKLSLMTSIMSFGPQTDPTPSVPQYLMDVHRLWEFSSNWHFCLQQELRNTPIISF